MEHNVYAPPAAMVVDAPRPLAREFYVVSRTKFLVLFFFTFGAYQLVWFYLHWARYRRHHGTALSPVWRSILALFFTHSLANKVDHALQRQSAPYRWAPGFMATGYVVCQVTGSICDRLALREIGTPTTDLLGWLMLALIAYFLWRIQDAANRACAQPDAESNRRFTWANWLWIVIGTVLWGFNLLAMAMNFGYLAE